MNTSPLHFLIVFLRALQRCLSVPRSHVDHTACVQKLVVFNHSSWADSAIMLYLFAPSGVSRAANSRIPVVGTIINSFQNIYVQSGERSAQSSDSSGLSSPLAPQSTTSLIGERCALFSVLWTIGHV